MASLDEIFGGRSSRPAAGRQSRGLDEIFGRPAPRPVGRGASVPGGDAMPIEAAPTERVPDGSVKKLKWSDIAGLGLRIGGGIIGGVAGGLVASPTILGVPAAVLAGGAAGAGLGELAAQKWTDEDRDEDRDGKRDGVNWGQVGMQTALGGIPIGPARYASRAARAGMGAIKGGLLNLGATTGTALAEDRLPSRGELLLGTALGTVAGGGIAAALPGAASKVSRVDARHGATDALSVTDRKTDYFARKAAATEQAGYDAGSLEVPGLTGKATGYDRGPGRSAKMVRGGASVPSGTQGTRTAVAEPASTSTTLLDRLATWNGQKDAPRVNARGVNRPNRVATAPEPGQEDVLGPFNQGQRAHEPEIRSNRSRGLGWIDEPQMPEVDPAWTDVPNPRGPFNQGTRAPEPELRPGRMRGDTLEPGDLPAGDDWSDLDRIFGRRGAQQNLTDRLASLGKRQAAPSVQARAKAAAQFLETSQPADDDVDALIRQLGPGASPEGLSVRGPAHSELLDPSHAAFPTPAAGDIQYRVTEDAVEAVSPTDGTVIGRARFSAGDGGPRLEEIAVNPNHQRQGIGTNLWERLQALFPDQAIDRGEAATDAGRAFREATPQPVLPESVGPPGSDLMNLPRESGGMPSGKAVVPGGITALFDRLKPQWRESLKETGIDMGDENVASFAHRIAAEENPRQLMWQERKLVRELRESGVLPSPQEIRAKYGPPPTESPAGRMVTTEPIPPPGGGSSPLPSRRLRAGEQTHFNTLYEDAKTQGYTGSRRDLERKYIEASEQAATYGDDMAPESEVGRSQRLLDAIRRMGGISLDDETGMIGEVRGLLEESGKAARGGRAKTGAGAGVIKGKGRGGLSLDYIREGLSEEPEFGDRYDNLGLLVEDVKNALRVAGNPRSAKAAIEEARKKSSLDAL